MSANTVQRIARDCLVGVASNNDDLHRFKHECFYRIPMRSVGRTISREALEESNILALYQTAAVTDGLPSAVEVWGEVVARDILLRRELIPSEAGHPAADEPYYRIALRNVAHLPAPIFSRTPRRISFLRTTRERLFHASDVNDLIVGTPEEEQIWAALCECGRPVERKVLMRVDGVVMEVDFAFVAAGQPTAVICGDEPRFIEGNVEAPSAWRVLRFSPVQLSGEFARCLEDIDRMLRE